MEQILADSLQVSHHIEPTTSALDPSINWWFWIALLELVIIILLLIERKCRTSQKKVLFKKQAKDADIDFANIIESSFEAKKLYNELIRKCHPDRFPMDQEKIKIATDLSLEIGKNKMNLKRLKELKQEAINQLKIKI